MIIPSIDLMKGKAVQLKQGREKVLEKENVLELAREFNRYGEIAVIDLDAALGQGDNLKLIKKICQLVECRVGGGIRTIERANELLRAGAKKIIISTRATPKFLKQLPKKRVIVAVDVKDNYMVNKGWRNKTKKKPQDVIKELEQYCSEFLFTNVNREGLMQGCDFRKVKKLKKLTKNKLTVAGGITSIEEIRELENLGLNSQLGMALYTGKINLDKAFVSLLDFEKNKGLIPTIVQDVNTKQVLMLSFSNPESLKKTLKSGEGTYYSRSRKKIWVKGETSGNFQEVVKVRYDCDRDTLLFFVKQKNVACHLGNYSCFGSGSKEFSLEELYQVIEDRISNPRKNSYTSKISRNEEKIKKKIREECEEILQYTDKENLIWEISDLVYFVTILMAKKGITLADIKNELWRRRK